MEQIVLDSESLNPEWFAHVDEDEVRTIISVERRIGDDDFPTFRSWLYRPRTGWKYDTRNCEDLPLPTAIEVKFLRILRSYGFEGDHT